MVGAERIGRNEGRLTSEETERLKAAMTKEMGKGGAEFAASKKAGAERKKGTGEKLDRKQAEKMGREILKEAREAGLTPEEAQAAISKALTEARERKAAEDARNLDLARKVQRKRAEQYLAGRTPEQYFKEMDTAIGKLKKEVSEMAGEWQETEGGRGRKTLGPQSEHERRMLEEARAELLRMQQKRALVQQALKGDEAGFVNERKLTTKVAKRPEAMPSKSEVEAVLKAEKTRGNHERKHASSAGRDAGQ